MADVDITNLGRRETWGDAPPTAGTWVVGDRVLSTYGSGSGWVCTVAGTPGTWEPVGGTFDVKDYGAVGDGVTDDSTAIQAAIDAAEAVSPVGTVYFPPASYYIATGLVIDSCNVDAANDAEITTDQTITAVTVGLSGTSNSVDALRMKLPKVVQSSQKWTATGGSSPMTGALFADVGVLVRNISSSELILSNVKSFSRGVQFQPGRDCTYNDVQFGHIQNCAIGIEINPLTTGWVNQNMFRGGRTSIASVAFPHITNTRGVLITGDTSGSNVPNGNTFLGVAFEGLEYEHNIRTEWAQSNRFISVRIEGQADIDFNEVSATKFSSGNRVEISYPAGYTATESTNSNKNVVGDNSTMLGQVSGDPVFGISNSSSGTNPVWATYDATDNPALAADIGKWVAGLTGTGIHVKRPADADSVSRFKVTSTYGNITLGNGEAELWEWAGSPESVIAANPGSICLDTSNGVLYLKTTGTGATGWLELQPSHTDSNRPAATAVPVGYMIYNTDDNAPNWSDGTNWRDAAGTVT